MLPQWVIEKKRNKQSLSKEEIEYFIEGYTKGDIPDYQMAAMAMAIYLNGMSFEETAYLTYAMMQSGDRVDTSSLQLPKVDKHSTGGIGDKVSLVLAPLMACCEVAVPMISGRGLGITGGTLDKMESIPGYRTDLSEKKFIDVLHACGCSIIGQTGEIAPADKKLYALRDVTATVPSIPLITASIMCKKLAEGIDALVLDVKWGKGAFMKKQVDARVLAENMVKVGKEMGKGMSALITGMNQPLGRSVGNALEVIESIEALRGNGPEDLMELTLSLCVQMLVLAKKTQDEEEAKALLQHHIDSGAAFEKFKSMVSLQGGNASFIDDPSQFKAASLIEEIVAEKSGFVSHVNAEDIGRAVLLLGAGRTRTDDAVDFSVGVSNLVKIGEKISEGERLLTLHANSQESLAAAKEKICLAFKITEDQVPKTSLINEIITSVAS